MLAAGAQATAGQLCKAEALPAACLRTSSRSTSGKAGLAHFSISTTGAPNWQDALRTAASHSSGMAEPLCCTSSHCLCTCEDAQSCSQSSAGPGRCSGCGLKHLHCAAAFWSRSGAPSRLSRATPLQQRQRLLSRDLAPARKRCCPEREPPPANFVNACPNRVNRLSPLSGGPASDQPGVAGRDVI